MKKTLSAPKLRTENDQTQKLRRSSGSGRYKLDLGSSNSSSDNERVSSPENIPSTPSPTSTGASNNNNNNNNSNYSSNNNGNTGTSRLAKLFLNTFSIHKNKQGNNNNNGRGISSVGSPTSHSLSGSPLKQKEDSFTMELEQRVSGKRESRGQTKIISNMNAYPFLNSNNNNNNENRSSLTSKSIKMDKPISNVEEELATRVRIASQLCKNLLSKKDKLYVKMIEWKHYVQANVHLDELGGITIRSIGKTGSALAEEQVFCHCKILPTQYFTVNHMPEVIPIQVSKKPVFKSVMNAKDKSAKKKDNTPNSNKVETERILCHVFNFIVEDYETTDQRESERDLSDALLLHSLLFAIEASNENEFKDWNQLFDLIMMRNMALLNVASQINRKSHNLLYRPRENRRQQIIDEMNLVKNSGIEDVIDLEQLVILYQEAIDSTS